jgi:hypothetical protein
MSLTPETLEALRPYATETQALFIDKIISYGSMRKAAVALGHFDHTTISVAIKRLKANAAIRGYAPDNDMVHEVPNPFIVKGVSTYYDKEGKPKGQWVKSSLDQQQYLETLEAIARGISADIRPAEPIAPPQECMADLLAIYPLGDPHAGLYSCIRETGSHFDLAEYERINMLAIDSIMEGTPKAATALYIDLGDTTHASDDKKRTPGSGHYLDTSGRIVEAIESAFKIKCYHIERLLTHHTNVIFRLNRGNHDPVTAVAISGMVRERYRNEPRVTVVDAFNPYWYYEFGLCMVATAHGDGAKGPQMGPIMANDQAPMWGRTKHRFAYLGHVHHRDAKEHIGVTVEYFGTLAAPDFYSHHAGYRSKRQIRSIVLHKDHGEMGGAVRNVSAFA